MPEALVPRGVLVYHVYRDWKQLVKYRPEPLNRYTQQSTRHNSRVVSRRSQVFY